MLSYSGQIVCRNFRFDWFISSRRCISKCPVWYNKSKTKGELSQLKKSTTTTTTTKDDSMSFDLEKTIKGRVMREIDLKEVSKNKYIVNLRNLSSKHYLWKKVLQFPIAVIDWTELPRIEKENSIIRNIIYLCMVISGFVLINAIVLWYFSEQHPITGRTVFAVNTDHIYTKYEDLRIAEITENNVGRFMPTSDPRIERVDRILSKLIESNKQFVEDENYDLNWTVSIVDDGVNLKLTTINNMKFIVTTKATVDLCENDDQLAYVIANEMAHFLLKHFREPLANIKPYNVWTAMKLLYLTRFWFIFETSVNFENIPVLKYMDTIDSASARILYRICRNQFEALNYSDELEQEADRIALQLLSRSCYDIREAEKFSQKCFELRKAKELELYGNKDNDKTKMKSKEIRAELEKSRYLFRNSFNQEKLNFFKENMANFIDFRKQCGCGILK